MRTSQISKDTARIRSTRRTARTLATATTRDDGVSRTLGLQRQVKRSTYDIPIETGSDDDGAPQSSGSDMSTPPSSADEDAYDSEASSNLGKRKRKVPMTQVKSEHINGRRTARRVVKSEPDAKSSQPKRKPAKRIKGERLSLDPPVNWEKMYDITANMRKSIQAPVDTMGCETLALKDIPAADQRLQTLVALMLSSQTKDTVTAVAMRNLQTEIPGGLNLTTLLSIEPEELNRLIGQVGFHNNKTKYLKATALILRDKFNGDIPSTIEGLTSLPGVGPKMAYLCMSAAWGRDEGIGVDVHVHRITNRWGWHKTDTPEQTREHLEAWLPKDKWHSINTLLVGLGQMVCLPVGRRCGECDLRETGLCPSALAASPTKRRAKVEVKTDADGEGLVVKTENVEIVSVKVEPDLAKDQPVAGVPDIEGLGAGTLIGS
ncbi:Hypothetical protein R9X50_00540000 [Acrodontium crateriforme]|uniref:Endonuclease III homolog n=1 Tax=Acrodontium crateriforme TaxID=150365 RepID=A0AAQ3RBH5_9PEZI|nr:Hypothetical protein R9X50_00540000 [Acrodontium crateriforme]